MHCRFRPKTGEAIRVSQPPPSLPGSCHAKSWQFSSPLGVQKVSEIHSFLDLIHAKSPTRFHEDPLKLTPRTAGLRTSNDHPPFGNGFRARHARGCAHHGAGGAVSVHAARANTIAAAAIGRTANHQRAVGQESGTRSLSADPAQYFCRPPYAVSQRGDGLRIARAPAKGLYEHLRALNRAARTLVRESESPPRCRQRTRITDQPRSKRRAAAE